jgi:AraC-like DNA-binding protein
MLEQTRPTGLGRAKGLVSNRASGSRIETKTFAPPLEIKEFVESLWVSQWDLRNQKPYLVQMLADPSVTIAFEAQRSRVVGISTNLWKREMVDRGLIRAVKLKPGAAGAFVAGSLEKLTNSVLPIRTVFSNIPHELERAVLSGDDENGFSHLTLWLQKNLKQPIDPKVHLAIDLVAHVQRHSEILTVDLLCKKSGLSIRPLQRLFRDFVGASPKWVIRRFRLQEAALQIERGNKSLTDIAAELGYADQAHFSRDFRKSTGRSPKELRDESR